MMLYDVGSLGAILRFLAFAALAILAPGIAVQRLLRVRPDPALVLPLGLSACALLYWLSLVTGLEWLFPLATLALGATLLRGRLLFAAGPSLRGAIAPLLAVVLAFCVAEYGQNRPSADGGFRLDAVQGDDAAFHVGLAFELAQGYPPQVPGLAGFPMSYHLGSSLVRAAAWRWAGVHPLDSLSRFDNTLGALALILALRAVTHALGGGPLAVALAGFSPLATDLSFLAAWGGGHEWWLGLFEGGTGLLSLFHANSLIPALALALGSLVAFRRHRSGEGGGWLALAALAALACPFFKVFLAAQLAGGLALASALARERRPIATLAAVAALATAALALGPGGDTMRVVRDPLRVVIDARADLGLDVLAGPALWLFTLPWLVISLGLRLTGVPRALRALASREPAAATLAAMALCGWPLGLLVRVSPLDAGVRQRPFNEALYFFEQSGFLLWIFAALCLGEAIARLPAARRALAAAACAALTLPSSVQFVAQKAASEPRRLSPAIVRAMGALAAASRPGDVVLQRPELQRYPPPPLLIGRRVPFTRFIPFFSQFAGRIERDRRFLDAAAVFAAGDAGLARERARALGAEFVCVYGADRLPFAPGRELEAVFEEAGAAVYRLRTGP
jgi:hypothetical protein